MEVAALEVAGDDAVAGAEEVGEEEEEAEDEHDGRTGGNVCPEGNEQTYDSAEGSECGTSPEHDIEGIAEEVDGGGGQDEEAEGEQNSYGLEG